MLNIDIQNEVNIIFEEIVAIRRKIHQNPELSFQEFNTTKFIQQKLDEVGITNHTALKSPIFNSEEYIGVIGVLGQGETSIGLRADIDALPISEETTLKFSSLNTGIMHACGHDMHTAMLLGAAKILKKYEKSLKTRVVLIFQPAEEMLPGGAKLILESGILDKYNIQAFFGQHINPELELGKLAVCNGPIMASTDELHITINGKSSHAAQPHLGNDVILASIEFIQYCQNLLVKFKNPLEAAVISITSIQAGNVTNILPDTSKLLGTIRTYNQDLRNKIKSLIREHAPSIVASYGCVIDLDIVEGYPPLKNDENTTKFIKSYAAELIGEENVIDAEPKMWAEDFAYYSQTKPSTFWFLGVTEKNQEIFPLHNPKLNPVESALKIGTSLFVRIALDHS
ncbi:MAG: hypothetical protein A2X64_02590 [Ignavibacteria bacterium GWF2_33_9]|nr:MAG: hypothetical protein A2X64_02590 [Ignavibacteria bacterium GWF2_33_9]